MTTPLVFCRAAFPRRFRCHLRPRTPWPLISLVAVLFATGPQFARATSVVAPSFPELVSRAQAIVRGEVTDVHSAWADSAQGPIIVTYVTLNVQKTLKGSATSPLVLKLLGGEIEGEGLSVAGMPKFKAGDTEIIFVAGNGARFCPIVGMTYGRYRVKIDPTTQRPYVARNDGSPVVREDLGAADLGVARVASVGAPLSTAEFEQCIATEVAHAATR